MSSDFFYLFVLPISALRCPWNEEIKITETVALVWLFIQVTVLS